MGPGPARRLAGHIPPKPAAAFCPSTPPAGFPVSREPSPGSRQASSRASVSPPAAMGSNIPIPGGLQHGMGVRAFAGGLSRTPPAPCHLCGMSPSHTSWTSTRLTPGPNPWGRHWTGAGPHQGARSCPGVPTPQCPQAPLSPRHLPAQIPGRCWVLLWGFAFPAGIWLLGTEWKLGGLFS